MRICFYNPHAVGAIWGRSAFSFLSPNKARRKHLGRFDFLLAIVRDRRYQSAIVVDGTASSFPLSSLGPIFNNRFVIRIVSFFEIYVWCLSNRINPLRSKIIFSFEKLDSNSDVLFGFAYLTPTFRNSRLIQQSFFTRFEGKKILHATHFYADTKMIADNIRATGTRVMAAETDLKLSGYFNQHFSFIDSVKIIPFALRERYASTKPFLVRKNKCIALGTLELFPERYEMARDHFDFFKINTIHPMRRLIYEHAKELSPVIDSLIDVYQNTTYQVEKSFLQKRLVYKLYKRLWAAFYPVGKAYHSFDIVKKYNEYQMFISPEENIGLPSINCIEGMACGCAYIGLDSPMYNDLGFEKNRHYIAYDGTVEGLREKVEYYRAHPEELRAIAERGNRYVLDHFKASQVTDTFLATIVGAKSAESFLGPRK